MIASENCFYYRNYKTLSFSFWSRKSPFGWGFHFFFLRPSTMDPLRPASIQIHLTTQWITEKNHHCINNNSNNNNSSNNNNNNNDDNNDNNNNNDNKNNNDSNNNCKGVILSVVSWKIIRPASLAMRQTVPAIHWLGGTVVRGRNLRMVYCWWRQLYLSRDHSWRRHIFHMYMQRSHYPPLSHKDQFSRANKSCKSQDAKMPVCRSGGVLESVVKCIPWRQNIW